MALQLIKDDILNFKADAIVNFISPEQLRDKSFFSSNLFEAAGPKLQYTLARWENLFQVSAAITRSYDLTGCRFIIHALGLDYPDPNSSELQQFEKSIEKVLDIAKDYRCKTLAFSLPGHYRLDASEKSVYSLLTGKIKQFLLAQDDANDMTIYLCIPGGENADAGSSLHDEVTQYVSQNYIDLEAEDSHLGNFIPNDDYPEPAESASFSLLREQLEEVVDTLAPREKRVLELRFGLIDGRTRTLEEVGKEFNVSRERIRQIEAKALRKLRHPSRSKRLKDFLDSEPVTDKRRFKEDFIELSPSISSGFEELSNDFPDSKGHEHPKESSSSTPSLVHAYAKAPSQSAIPRYKEQDKSFIEMVDWWLNEKNIRMKDFYIHSNLNRAMLSNLRCHPSQTPKKTNAIACAIGLELNLAETTDLLDRAGFSLSKYVKTDVIVEYFIKNGIFDIFKINEELFANDLVLLGTG